MFLLKKLTSEKLWSESVRGRERYVSMGIHASTQGGATDRQREMVREGGGEGTASGGPLPVGSGSSRG